MTGWLYLLWKYPCLFTAQILRRPNTTAIEYVKASIAISVVSVILKTPTMNVDQSAIIGWKTEFDQLVRFRTPSNFSELHLRFKPCSKPVLRENAL